MSTVLHPVGSKPPNVYWRRRVAAGIVLLLVVLLLSWMIKSVIGWFTPDQTQTPAAAPASNAAAPAANGAAPAGNAAAPAVTSGATAAPSAAAVTNCDPTTLNVAATSDSRTYKLGSAATLGMTITNTGTAACTMDAGSAALELIITSGSDRVWSSDDCQQAGESRPTTVEPGEKGRLASSVPWKLERSSTGCGADLPALKAGTYQLVARAGEIKSEPLTLTVQS